MAARFVIQKHGSTLQRTQPESVKTGRTVEQVAQDAAR